MAGASFSELCALYPEGQLAALVTVRDQLLVDPGFLDSRKEKVLGQEPPSEESSET
jgi:hypothetical protein